MSRFDDIKIGDRAELKHLITQDDISKFVELTGDDNKLHIDAEYALNTSFKKPVAHGMLGASFISTIIGTKIPGDGALWFSQNIEFLLPVRIGDEITVKAEVLKKNELLKVIELQTDIYNQHKQKVTGGIAKVKIIEQLEINESPVKDESTYPRNALIIGGTGGIGSAACLQMAEDGFNIAIHYNSNKAFAEELSKKISGLGRKCCIVSGDITSSGDAQEIVDQVNRKLGNISVVVNCSTLKIPNIKFEKLEWDDFQNHLNINVRANFYIAQQLIPSMKKQAYGKFIFLTSQVTENVPPAEWSFYTTAKYSLNGFAKSLAVELAPFNIKVNLVSPGMTETNLISDIPEKMKLIMAARTPLRRLAMAEDIANAISFLASNKSDYITGETIRINGGQVML
jgi:3-oxoacyl-[acyl-carrier protein] reductase